MDTRIAKEIKSIRLELGLTQAELAAAAKTNSQNIANYECRRAMPPVITYLKIKEIREKFDDLVKRRKELLRLCD